MIGIFLDIETTGLDPSRHRILDIAFKFINLKNGNLLKDYSSRVHQPTEVWELRDPVSIQINGFTEEDLKNSRTENEVAKEVIEIFQKYEIRRGRAFFLCQNPAFDRAFFSHLIPIPEQEREEWPYHWLDFASMYWALRVKQKQLGITVPGIETSHPIFLSKDSIATQYGLPKESSPHRAHNGVNHLLLCYEKVIGWGDG